MMWTGEHHYQTSDLLEPETYPPQTGEPAREKDLEMLRVHPQSAFGGMGMAVIPHHMLTHKSNTHKLTIVMNHFTWIDLSV